MGFVESFLDPSSRVMDARSELAARFGAPDSPVAVPSPAEAALALADAAVAAPRFTKAGDSPASSDAESVSPARSEGEEGARPAPILIRVVLRVCWGV